jgi:PAS domain S-box-containing protein
MESKMDNDKIRQKLEDLELMNSVNIAVNRGDSLNKIIELVSIKTRKFFSSFGATVYLLSKDEKYLVMQKLNLPSAVKKRIEGLIRLKITALKIPLRGKNQYYKILKGKKPQVINDVTKIKGILEEFVEAIPVSRKIMRAIIKKLIPEIYKILGIRSIMIVPLITEGKVLGLMDISGRKPFNIFDIERISTISEQLAIAINKKQTENNLRFIFEGIKTSENRFKKLFEYISSGVAVYEAVDNGSDFIFKDFNRAAEKIDKIKKKDLIGKSVLKIFPEVKDFGLFDVFKKVYKTGKPEKYPISFYSDNRISGWRRNYIYKLPTGEIVAVYDDMTRQKQAEESLRISEEFSSSLMKNSPSPIMVVNADTSIKYVNPALENLVGLKSDEILGKKPPYPWWPAGLENKYDWEFKEVLKEGCIKRELLFNNKMGEKFWVEVDGKPIFSNGELKYLIITWFDITDRKIIGDNLKISYHKLQKILEGTINTLAAIVEIKDPYTSGHQKRVSRLAVAISSELGLESKIIESIRIAAEIHDIGKINIPASILSKPGKLTDIEYDMIKTHPQMSYDMINKIEFPMPIAEIILQHHEKMDGSGYPRGLKEKDIMLEAKILAVADVVEAMSSYRPYRPALGLNAAIEEIKKNKGKLYDPKIVDVCIKIISRKEFKFD